MAGVGLAIKVLLFLLPFYLTWTCLCASVVQDVGQGSTTFDRWQQDSSYNSLPLVHADADPDASSTSTTLHLCDVQKPVHVVPGSTNYQVRALYYEPDGRGDRKRKFLLFAGLGGHRYLEIHNLEQDVEEGMSQLHDDKKGEGEKAEHVAKVTSESFEVVETIEPAEKTLKKPQKAMEIGGQLNSISDKPKQEPPLTPSCCFTPALAWQRDMYAKGRQNLRNFFNMGAGRRNDISPVCSNKGCNGDKRGTNSPRRHRCMLTMGFYFDWGTGDCSIQAPDGVVAPKSRRCEKALYNHESACRKEQCGVGPFYQNYETLLSLQRNWKDRRASLLREKAAQEEKVRMFARLDDLVEALPSRSSAHNFHPCNKTMSFGRLHDTPRETKTSPFSLSNLALAATRKLQKDHDEKQISPVNLLQGDKLSCTEDKTSRWGGLLCTVMSNIRPTTLMSSRSAVTNSSTSTKQLTLTNSPISLDSTTASTSSVSVSGSSVFAGENTEEKNVEALNLNEAEKTSSNEAGPCILKEAARRKEAVLDAEIARLKIEKELVAGDAENEARRRQLASMQNCFVRCKKDTELDKMALCREADNEITIEEVANLRTTHSDKIESERREREAENLSKKTDDNEIKGGASLSGDSTYFPIHDVRKAPLRLVRGWQLPRGPATALASVFFSRKRGSCAAFSTFAPDGHQKGLGAPRTYAGLEGALTASSPFSGALVKEDQLDFLRAFFARATPARAPSPSGTNYLWMYPQQDPLVDPAGAMFLKAVLPKSDFSRTANFDVANKLLTIHDGPYLRWRMRLSGDHEGAQQLKEAEEERSHLQDENCHTFIKAFDSPKGSCTRFTQQLRDD
ncbi:unnamed protein product [Amoebophrya sp. A25]|nr:unnamed protein product [Amoebophrya sp. A25]|eukprot:GSA25T00014304001.1